MINKISEHVSDTRMIKSTIQAISVQIRMQIAMDELDEIDKQSIALYGVMQEKKSTTNRIGAHNHAKNVVTLDRK